MSLFNWLRGAKEKVQIGEHRIWLSKEAKFAGIQREIAAALADPGGPDVVFVVAHFQDALDELRALVAGAGSGKGDRSNLPERPSGCSAQIGPVPFSESGGRVVITSSAGLEGTVAGAAFSESRRILIIVGERHPLASHDEVLLRFARSLSCQCRLVQHVSLEDPLVKTFAGEWVRNVLRQLGMDEDDPIESRMVGRRIRGAQQKIASRATGDLPAGSAEEWLAKNCPK